MTKADFINYMKTRGIYEASLCACMAGIAMATVQLWVRGAK